MNPQVFSLTAQNGTLNYIVTNDSPPVAYSSFSTSGGVITTSGGNTIVTFRLSGTLNVSGSTTATVMVVGSGAGGGGINGIGDGGGGGGGIVTSSYALTAGSINVTIGNGGAGGANNGVTYGQPWTYKHIWYNDGSRRWWWR